MRSPIKLHGDPFPSPDANSGTAPVATPAAPHGGASADLFGIVLRALRHHWRLAVTVFTVLGLGSAAVAYVLVKPVYTAAALLYVDPILPSLAFTTDSSKIESMATFVEPYKATLVGSITTPPVLAAAADELEKSGVAWRSPDVPVKEAMRELKENFAVEAPRNVHHVTVSLSGEDPSKLAPIVNAVTEKFLERLEREEASRVDARLETITKERETLETRLNAVGKELAKFVTDAGGNLLDERQNILYDRIQALEKDLTTVALDCVDAESAVITAQRRAEDLRKEVPNSVLEEAVTKDQSVSEARGLAVRSRHDLENEFGNLADDHPARAQALYQVKAAEDAMKSAENSTRERLRMQLTQSREIEAVTKIRDAELELEERRKARELLQGQIDAATLEFRSRAEAISRSGELRDEQDRLQDVLKKLDNRIDEDRVESRAPARVSLKSPASAPLEASDDKRLLWASACAAGGAVLALATALLALLVRPRVLAENVERRLGLPVLLRTPMPTHPREVPQLFARLQAGRVDAVVRTIVVAVDPVAETVALELAEMLTMLASRSSSALLIGLSAPSVRGNAPREEVVETRRSAGSSVVVWKSLGGAREMREFLNSADFRVRFEELSANADARFIGMSALLARELAAKPIFAEGYSVVFVAQADRSMLHDLRSAARDVWSSNGDVAGVVLIDPGMVPIARTA